MVAFMENHIIDQQVSGYDVTLFCDRKKPKDNLCNIEFAKLIHYVCEGNLDAILSAKVNRGTSHFVSFCMLEKLCSLAGTDNFYAEHVGQKKFAVAAAENSRMLKHQHAHKVYEDFKRNKRNQLGPLKKKISLDCSYISNQHFDGEERSSFPVEHPNDE